MTKLKVENLKYSINNEDILKSINMEVKKGEFVGLIGANGSGKSTLLKCIYRSYKADGGKIFIDGSDMSKLSNKEVARKMAVMVQENNLEFDMKVLDMVLMGRYSHKRLLESNSGNDYDIAKNSLEEVGLKGYEERNFFSLSGGEKQRVLIARALTQEAEFIVLDEPTNHLDIRYQFQIMNILKKQDITVFSSVHDLNIAAHYCDKIIAINNGEIIHIGTPKEVLTNEIIKEIFGVETEVGVNERTGKISITYIPTV